MRKQNGATTGFGRETEENVLPKGIISPALRRRAVHITSPWVGGESIAVPLFDGIWRIGQAYIEPHEAVAFDELGFGQGVAPDYLKVFDAMKEAVHPGNGRGHEISLLTIK